MNTIPNYAYRKASISDMMFFFESMTSLENALIDTFEFENNFKSKILDSNYYLFIIEDMHNPVGCVVLQKVYNLSDPSPWVEILEFFIQPKYRKLKAADYFYHTIETFVSEMGIFKMKVSCKVNSTISQHFFTKRGYKIQRKVYSKFVQAK